MRASTIILACLLLTASALAASAAKTYSLPGDQVFPEGVAYDASGHDYYVGSNSDGTIFRGSIDGTAAQPFLAAGADGRTSATGLKVSGAKLFVAGAATGRFFVYSLAGKLLARFDTGSGGFLNDIAVEPDGDVVVTDSQRLFLYKWTAAQIRAGKGAPKKLAYKRGAKGGFNANGIVPLGAHSVLFVDSGDGTLTRMDTDSGKTMRVKVSGGPLTNGDGLVVRGHVLYVVRNANGRIAVVRLSRTFGSGRVVRSVTDSALHYPTTAAVAGYRLLVVNSQFDKRGPGLTPGPFTLSSIPLPSSSS
jgi:Cu-Zn family superoxide dismutase